MDIFCRKKYTQFQNADGFSIATFKAEDKVDFPNGRSSKTFTAKGYLLPEENILVKLSGEFEKYKDKYTLVVTGVEEIMPTEKTAILTYLTTLSGVGNVMAEKMYEKFSISVFDVMENEPEKLTQVSGISTKTANKILTSYAKKKYARKLFEFLMPYHISEQKIFQIASKLSDKEPLEEIQNNPYLVSTLARVPFETADRIAKELSYPANSANRIYAAIHEVLMQSEYGGNLFTNYARYPAFMYKGFLKQEHFNLLYDSSINVTGSTYITSGICYIKLLALLNLPLTEADFFKYLVKMQGRKEIYVGRVDNEIFIYRYQTARAEHLAANKVFEMAQQTVPYHSNIVKVMHSVQSHLMLKLTDEQRMAVKTAIHSPISILTGGPGTGKTSVQKCLIETFKCLYPEEEVVLIAPTGMAAKRMESATGYPASTIHSKLQLYTSNDGELQSKSTEKINAGLVIVDEASMIGSFVFSELINNITEGTRLLLVGDVDQLPSIEIGTVLDELIKSKTVPVTRLTKTFRQAFGSSIAQNASRIRVGETILEYDKDFTLVECDSSQEIADKVCDIYSDVVEDIGIENVIVLSAFRKSTESGTDQLNQTLRERINTSITPTSPFFERRGVKFYENDRVMWTVNTDTLTNGDIGTILSIVKSKDALKVSVDFDGYIAELDEDDVVHLELALAITVHKSQGGEFNTVIMVVDQNHSTLLTRRLIFTGITRASKRLIIVGQSNALAKAIKKEDSAYRRSLLSRLLITKQEKLVSELKKTLTDIQMSMDI